MIGGALMINNDQYVAPDLYKIGNFLDNFEIFYMLYSLEPIDNIGCIGGKIINGAQGRT